LKVEKISSANSPGTIRTAAMAPRTSMNGCDSSTCGFSSGMRRNSRCPRASAVKTIAMNRVGPIPRMPTLSPENTLVTMNANGLVGTVQGLAFMVTSVFSGLSIGILGMGPTLFIAIGATALAFAHLLFLRIPEEKPHVAEGQPIIDVRGAWGAIKLVPGLFALILFSTFNNLIGGVYMALMDPYGLELFAVEWWGVVFAVASTGFIIGGLFIAKFGLGKNPIRTMLLLVIVMGALGALFTIRESWLLYAAGIWLYMTIIPAVEASEQTVIQKVVPFRTQGRVFGFASAFEAAAAPITAFLIAPIAEFVIIPYMSGPGERTWAWLLGEGDARGIAFVFLIAGLAMIVIALLAFLTKSYRTLSAVYADQKESVVPDEVDGADLDAESSSTR